MSATNSILECLVYFDKAKSTAGIPLPLVLDYCNVDTATPLCISLISNEEGMRQAFDCIGSVLVNVLDNITAAAYDIDKKAHIYQSFANELSLFLGTTVSNDLTNMNPACYNFFTLRLSSTPFINFIKGNRQAAIKQLSKYKDKTGYENRLLNIWKSEEHSQNPDLSAIIKNAATYKENGMQRASGKEFASIFLSWILMLPLISVVYIAIYFVLVCIEGSGSIYLMGPMYNFPYCICCAFITSIAASYFTRFKFYKWLYKKDYEIYCEMDYIQNGGGADKLMKGFLYTTVLASLVFSLLLSKWNINFLQDGFADNSKFLSLHGEYHSYHEVECVYYKSKRTNDFGETLDFPSYVLKLKNGKEIDFYEFDDLSKYEDELLEFLRDKDVKIESPQ